MTILKIDDQLRLEPQGIGDRFTERALGQHLYHFLIEPLLDFFQDGLGQLVANSFSLLRGFLLGGTLYLVQLADQCHHLVSSRM